MEKTAGAYPNDDDEPASEMSERGAWDIAPAVPPAGAAARQNE
jgi:hypothetical protein